METLPWIAIFSEKTDESGKEVSPLNLKKIESLCNHRHGVTLEFVFNRSAIK